MNHSVTIRVLVPLTLRRFNLTVEHRTSGILVRTQSLARGLPSGAVRIFIPRSPVLGWPTPCGSSRYALGCHARRVWARSVPFRSVPFRGVDPRGRWISLIVSRRMGRDGSSTRPLYSTAFSLPFLLLSTFASSAFTVPLFYRVFTRSRIDTVRMFKHP